MPQIKIALEGIVHAGKTTLLHALQRQRDDVCCIDEYTVYRGEKHFPPFPKSSKEALNANQFFIELDVKRFADVTDASIVLLDRSCVSVIAYHYATEQSTGGQIQCFTTSLQLFQTVYRRFVPDVVVYLEISMDNLEKRHIGDKGVYKGILLNHVFNEHLCTFYEKLHQYFPEVTVIKIDGGLPPMEVLAEVNKVINSL